MMKYNAKLSVLMGILGLVICSFDAFAQENLSFEGFKLAVGAGMTSAGGTAKTTGTGIYSGDTTSAGGGAASGGPYSDTYRIDSSSSFEPNKYIGRVELGYDWAINENGIIGLSLSKDFKSNSISAGLGTTLTLDNASCVDTGVGDPCPSSVDFRESPSMTMDGPYSLALRAGYVTTKDSMVFAKISYANSKVHGDINKTAHGLGLGLGFEANLSEHWFMRGELETIQYAKFDVTTQFNDSFVGTTTDQIKLRTNSARVLIGVRF